MAAPPRQQVFPVTVALVFGSNMLVKLSPTLTLSRGSAKTTSAIEERISRSPYKEMDILENPCFQAPWAAALHTAMPMRMPVGN